MAYNATLRHLIKWIDEEEQSQGASSTVFALKQLELSFEQARDQARRWLFASLFAARICLLLVGLSIVVAIVSSSVTTGLITVSASSIPGVAAALFFAQWKAAIKRVDDIQKSLTRMRELQNSFEIADTIEDPKSRDKLKAEIVRKTLRIERRSGIRGK